MIVIGTAGHIDHGKSAIVKRLTGTDPDRLPEEKKRGMTIDLGFAFFQTSAEEDIAFVDVPGHERFVRNMIAGAGGTDSVMLVIAADDGWMPQSREHFQIIKLLGIKHGLIVINKIDLVDQDWLDLVEADVREKTSESFLADVPLFRVSAQTGEGFDTLAEYLNGVPSEIASRKDIGKARLCADRSFVRTGYGQVVTGTLRGSSLSVGQAVSVWPDRVKGKIRTLQSKGVDVERVAPGQRTSVSLTGVDKESMVRGGVISDRDDLSFFADHPVLALKVELIEESPVTLTDRRRLLLIVGATEMNGEVRMFDSKEIRPGESGIVFFKPDQPVFTLVGDHFVIRLITPMVTVGGGVILDHLPHLPRRKQLDQFVYLKDRQSGRLEDLVVSELRKGILVPLDRLLLEADFAQTEVETLVDRLVKEELLGRFGLHVFHQQYLDEAVGAIKQTLENDLKDKAHLKGLTLENMLRLSPYPESRSGVLMEYMLAAKVIVQEGDLYNIAGRGMSLKGVIKEAHDKIMKQLKADPFAPPTLSSFAKGGKVNQQAIKYMIDTGEVYKCGADFIFLTEVWSEVLDHIRQVLDRDGELKVTDLREKFSFSRKWVIPIVEETDRIGVTERRGDIRVKGDKF